MVATMKVRYQKKESGNLKKYWGRLLNLKQERKKIEDKLTETSNPVRQNKVFQYKNNRYHRNGTERNMGRKKTP